jgi:GT2 family glycosyltransferase
MIEAPERLSKQDGFRVFGMGANFAARRRLFEDVGPFDEILGGGGPLKSSQDFDMTYRTFRSGGAILLRPEVVMRHDGHRAPEDWPALLHNYGFGDGAFYMKHVRCRDPYAAWLFARRLTRATARWARDTIKRAEASEGSYVKGAFAGARASFKFGVDRDRRLYVQR